MIIVMIVSPNSLQRRKTLWTIRLGTTRKNLSPWDRSPTKRKKASTILKRESGSSRKILRIDLINIVRNHKQFTTNQPTIKLMKSLEKLLKNNLLFNPKRKTLKMITPPYQKHRSTSRPNKKLKPLTKTPNKTSRKTEINIKIIKNKIIKKPPMKPYPARGSNSSKIIQNCQIYKKKINMHPLTHQQNFLKRSPR